jgi:hypothetical protein
MAQSREEIRRLRRVDTMRWYRKAEFFPLCETENSIKKVVFNLSGETKFQNPA